MPKPFANLSVRVRALTAGALLVSTLALPLQAAPEPGEAVRPTADEATEAYAAFAAANLAIADARDAARQGKREEARTFWQEAATHLEKAAAADPASREVFIALFACYVRLKQNDKAAEALARMADQAPDTPEAHRDMARIYKSLGKVAMSIEEFRKAVKAAEAGDKEWHDLSAELALLLRAAGRANDAVVVYRGILKLMPEDQGATLGLGYALGESGRHEDAIAVLLPLAGKPEALKEGEDIRVTYFLAGEYRKAGKAAEGADAFAELAEKLPESAEVCQSRMHLLDSAKRRDEAIRIGEAFIKAHPDASAVQLILADLTSAAGNPKRAAQIYRALLPRTTSLRNACARQLVRVADLLVRKDKHDEAITALKGVIAAEDLDDTVLAQAHLALASIRRRRGEATLGLEELDAVKSSKIAKQWPLQITRAELLDAAGRTDEAVALLEKALDTNAGNAAALEHINLMLGTMLLLGDGADARKAEEHLRRVLVIDPKHAGAANCLGYLYALNDRDLDEGEKLLGIALKERPKEPAFLDSLGWVYYKQALRDNSTRRLALAVETLKAAAEKADDGVVLDHLAEAHFVNGEWEDALAAWKKALATRDEPGQEPLDRGAVQAKLKHVRGLLADEAKAGAAHTPGQRRAKKLQAPDTENRN